MDMKITMTRRAAIGKTALLVAGASAYMVQNGGTLAQPAADGGPFSLPPLPYPSDALEPHIDARTMEIHHGRHHATYVSNLNRAISKHQQLANRTIHELIRDLQSVPEDIRNTVRNNGGGHLNHMLFWQMMSKEGGGQPRGGLASAIDRRFGGIDGFKERFSTAATSVFGSGWAWLTLKDRELNIETTPNQDNPISHGNIPLLGLDVWEHAYYLKYQNRRTDYISAWYNVINWNFVSDQYRKYSA
jgi:superoxide dismutase, Fe-Mn family